MTFKLFNRQPCPFNMLLLIVFVTILAACSDDDDDEMTVTDPTITSLVQEDNNLSSLEAALTKFPDLVSALNTPSSSFTVFAPTNQAFQQLLAATGQSSLDDIPESVLREVLEYHVISSAVLSSDLESGNVETFQGENVAVVVNNSSVTLNGSASVTSADVTASNGVVHVIDAVILPPSITPIVGTIVAPAYFNKSFSTLVAAVMAADESILETLLSNGPSDDGLTLFAPTNAAFEAAGITTLPDEATLNAVLAYHVVDGTVMSGDLPTGSAAIPTLNGDFYLSNNGSGVFINGTTQVTSVDIEGSNGVVHVINRVLLPPSQTIAEIVSENATENNEFTMLLAALQRTSGQGANDLLAAVSGEGDFTVFAPTDAAFEELLGATDINDVPLDNLIAILKHHVVAARVFSTDLSSGEVSTLNGDVTVDLSATPPTITGASGGDNIANLQTTLLNIHASNGVIHVIDKVLVP